MASALRLFLPTNNLRIILEIHFSFRASKRTFVRHCFYSTGQMFASLRATPCARLALVSALSLSMLCDSGQTASAQAKQLTIAGISAEQASQADAFVDSIGVVTHLTYDDTAYYKAWPQVFDGLRTLGVRHIRDGFYDYSGTSPFTKEHSALASVGVKTTYVVPWETSTTEQTLEQFAANVGDVEAFEAPNECDIAANCGGGGLTGINNMMSLIPQIRSAANKLGLPLIAPSFVLPSSYLAVGNISSLVTYNNLHTYFGGMNPGSEGWGDFDSQGNSYGSFSYWLDQANLDAPNVPSVVTETGYISYPNPTRPYTIPESIGASYIPRTLLLAFAHGVKRTFIYELLDEFSSPGYGLVHGDFSPKPAYNSIRNLISVLSDPGPSFVPGSLSYSVSGADSSLNHLLLQKRDGSYWLVLWLEKSGFDRVTLTPTPVAPQNIVLTVNGGRSAQQLLWIDQTGYLSWKNIVQVNSQVSLNVTDQVSIVKILP